MARIFKIKELEARKRALAEESDLYRQALGFELHNLQLHATLIKRRAAWLTLSPLWALLPQLLKAFMKKKQPSSPKWRIFSAAMAAWQLYRKVSRFIPAFFARRSRLRGVEQSRAV